MTPAGHVPITPESTENGDAPPPPVESFLEQALEGLDEGCLLLDSTDRIRFSNEAAKQMLKPKGRLLGRKLEALLADRGLSLLAAECFRTGRTAQGHFALRLPGEAWRDDRHLQATAAAVQLGESIKYVRLAIRPDPEADAQSKQQSAPMSDTLLQLRGPLSIVQGYLENLLDGMITDPVALRHSLLAMRKSTVQIERTLESLKA